MTLRNSRAYRLLSKLIGPLTKNLNVVHGADPDFSSVPVMLDRASVAADWKWYQPQLIAPTFTDSGLILKCLCESVWYQNLRGPMLYRYISGDCRVSVSVRTRKSSDDTNFPDSQWQFGGVIFRDPSCDSWLSRESYVFNVIGYRATGLQIENKSTHNGYSKVTAHDWDTGDAEILIDRQGSKFVMKAKPLGSNEWLEMCRYTRPDFPDVLQMGLLVYAYSEGREIFDLQAEFSNFNFTQL